MGGLEIKVRSGNFHSRRWEGWRLRYGVEISIITLFLFYFDGLPQLGHPVTAQVDSPRLEAGEQEAGLAQPAVHLVELLVCEHLGETIKPEVESPAVCRLGSGREGLEVTAGH